MSHRLYFGLGLMLALAGLLGCAQSGAIYSQSDPHVAINGFYDDGAGGRDLKLVVTGNPFVVPDAVFQQTIEADLADGTVAGRQPTHPRLEPGPSAKSIYRLVFAFDAPNEIYADALCDRDLSGITPRVQKSIRAVAAFCVGSRAYSYVDAGTEADSPGDPRLRHLVRDMMMALFRLDLISGPGPQQIQ